MYDVIASAMYREKVRPRSSRETGLGHVQVSREAGEGETLIDGHSPGRETGLDHAGSELSSSHISRASDDCWCVVNKGK